MAQKRSYSDETKGAALAILDATRDAGVANFTQASKLTKIPASTLKDWDSGRHVVPEVTDIRDLKKGELADEMERAAHALVERLIALVPGETDMKAVAMSMGIATDKMRLLRGESTADVTSGGKPIVNFFMPDNGRDGHSAASGATDALPQHLGESVAADAIQPS